MILQYVDIFSGGETKKIKARITTEHSASSYGQPVVVLDDGEGLNAESWVLLGYQVVSATKAEAELMERWLKNLYAMLGIAGNPAAALGRRGGLVKSERKTAAVRENAKKGGRPKTMRDRKHYEDLLSRNQDATVGFALAADAIYAARHGVFTPGDRVGSEWREIARDLKNRYGESLTVDEVRKEMEEGMDVKL
jgi:hypothetical protein